MTDSAVLPPPTLLSVGEGDDDLLSFKLHEVVDGNLQPYDLTSATITFDVKNDPDDASAAFSYSTTGGEITIADAEGGLFTVQFDRTDVDTAGNFHYRIRVEQNSKRRTVARGPLEVVNL